MCKRFWWFLLLPYHLFACALCALYTPSATVNITLEGDASTLKAITFEWHFSQDFIKTLIDRYDDNRNKKLDPDELKRIEIILNNYVAKKHYLTSVEYTARGGEQAHVVPLSLHVSRKELFFQTNDDLVFRFRSDTTQALLPEDELSFTIEDNEGFFVFLIHGIQPADANVFPFEFNLFNHIAFMKISGNAATRTQAPVPSEPRLVAPITPEKQENTRLEVAPSSESSRLLWLKNALSSTQNTIQDTMSGLKEKASFAGYLLFLGLSFLYGVLHAAGPGHGKTLVSSYLFAANHGYAKALSMAGLIGLVHTFSAFLLTLTIYLLFDLFFNAFFTDVSFYTTKISALIILAIVAYMAYRKIKVHRARPKIVAFSAHPFTCSCAACSPKSQSSDWGVVLSAGIVPCPGTVAIFTFALAHRAYSLGFLSAFCMSFGMSLIIAAAAFSTLYAKKRFRSKTPRFLIYSESIALAIMFTLGLVLLFS